MKKDLTGQKFNRLTVVGYGGERITYTSRKYVRYMWICQCDCGNQTIVEQYHLTSGHTTSCGCKLRENQQNNLPKYNYVNGLAGTRLDRAYRNMLNRCYNKKTSMYQCYGAKGVKVCDEWQVKNNGFKNFCDWALSHGYTDELTLDRIDPKENYSPSNCRWASIKEQANNKRNTHYVKVNGEIDTVGNWASRLNISYWNLLHYANGISHNTKYPELQIERV